MHFGAIVNSARVGLSASPLPIGNRVKPFNNKEGDIELTSLHLNPNYMAERRQLINTVYI